MAPDLPGRVAVTARALENTVSAIAADRLSVRARDVAVKLTDDSALLAIEVSSPLAVPSLRSYSGGDGIPTRIAAARRGIESDVLAIAGTRVGRVSVEITRVDIREPARVS